MEDAESEDWKTKIAVVRREKRDLGNFVADLRGENRLTRQEDGALSAVWNKVFTEAGRHSVNDPNNALTYALFRQANHVYREELIKLIPEIRERLDQEVPPVRGQGR